MFNIVVFVSGRVSNLKALLEKLPKGKIRVCAVVSDKKDCGAVQFAVQNKIPVFLVSTNNQTGFFNYNDLRLQLKKIPADLIVLAGFLKMIPGDFVEEFEFKIINIHPALLPEFGGSGMYGMNVHRAVFDSSKKMSGATVHFVDKIYDHGMIIAQRSVDITDVKTPDEIAGRVLEIEHELLPFVVEKFAGGKIIVNDDGVTIAD